MNTDKMVKELDAEIAKLTTARNILAGIGGAVVGNRNRIDTGRVTELPKRRSHLSAAGRKRISELMKKRWAERRKKAAAKSK